MQRPLQAHWRRERLAWPQPSWDGTGDENADRKQPAGLYRWNFRSIWVDAEEPALQLWRASQQCDPPHIYQQVSDGAAGDLLQKVAQSRYLFRADQLTPVAFVFFDTRRPFSGFSGRHSSSSSSLSFSLGDISSSMSMAVTCAAFAVVKRFPLGFRPLRRPKKKYRFWTSKSRNGLLN